MLIDRVYEQVRLFSNKSQIGGYIGTNDYNRFAKFAQREIIDELSELLDYNQKTAILCGDVLKRQNVFTKNGVVQEPSDYYKYADGNAVFFVDESFQVYPIDYITTSERGERLRSKIVSPTTDYPIATETTAGLLVEPTSVKRVELTYFIDPVDPEWVGTDTVPPVFDPNASTDFVLSNRFETVLVYKICSYFSIEIRDGELSAATTKQLINQM